MDNELYTQLDARPVQWTLASGIDERGFIVGGSMLDARDSLPTEFFNNELMDVNPDDEESVVEFAKKWGIMAHPERFGHSARHDKPTQHQDAPEESPFMMLAVPLEEMQGAIRLLQACITAMRKYILHGDGFEPDWLGNMPIDWKYAAAIINKCASSSHRIDFGLNVLQRPITLTSAICNQVIDTIADPAPWLECAYCGKPFKHQHNAQTSKKKTGTLYCSSECYENMKNTRKGFKKPPQHWRDNPGKYAAELAKFNDAKMKARKKKPSTPTGASLEHRTLGEMGR